MPDEADYQGTRSSWGRHGKHTGRTPPDQGVPGAEMAAPQFPQWDDQGNIIPPCVICRESGLKVDDKGRCERCIEITKRSLALEPVSAEGETQDGDVGDSGSDDDAPDDVAVPKRKAGPKKSRA